MKFKWVVAFCLSVLVIGPSSILAEPGFQKVLDNQEGALLLDDGSIWEFDAESCCFVKGDLIKVIGEYQTASEVSYHDILVNDSFKFEGRLVGWLGEESKILHAFEFSINRKDEEENEKRYGHFFILESGKVLIGDSSTPYNLKRNQLVYLSNFSWADAFLIDKESLTFINRGLCLGDRQTLPVIRRVKEIEDGFYICHDGFRLPRSLNLGVDDLRVLENPIFLEFDRNEPMKLTLKFRNDENWVKIFVDFSEKFCLEVETVMDISDEKTFQENVLFVGSPELKNLFLQKDLKIGDTLQFFGLKNSPFGEEFENNFYMILSE